MAQKTIEEVRQEIEADTADLLSTLDNVIQQTTERQNAARDATWEAEDAAKTAGKVAPGIAHSGKAILARDIARMRKAHWETMRRVRDALYTVTYVAGR